MFLINVYPKLEKLIKSWKKKSVEGQHWARNSWETKLQHEQPTELAVQGPDYPGVKWPLLQSKETGILLLLFL